MSEDAALLRRYVLQRDNDAFSELVRRTIDFVYAAALRQCRGNPALAQDVTQLVFTDLARRAPTVVHHPALAGWLHTATRFAAMKVLRTESRRQHREQQAAELQALLSEENAAVDWTQLRPVLDDAIGELKERDRAAILLRYFQGKSLLAVGVDLRLSEAAARSCVDRALDRLRGRLARRGVTSTSAALSLALAQQITTAAPAGLAHTISGVAIAGSTVGGAALVPFFAMKKIIVTAAALGLVVELATIAVELNTRRSLEADLRALESADGAPPSPLPPASSISARPAPSTDPSGTQLLPDEATELARLEKRRAQLAARPPGVIDAQMKTPRAVGRDTPEAAMQTLTAALRDHDLAALDRFVFFSDDTPQNRAAFMASFSESVRARYPTPERLMIAFSFDQVLRDSPVAQQVLSTNGYSGGVQTVTTWTRLASGHERQDTVPFGLTAEGWALSAQRLATTDNPALDLLRRRIDPSTGAVIPAKK